jgi:hypothetical protein
MIQSACDPGAPQKETRQAIRGRFSAVCGTAPVARPVKAAKPAMPVIPTISRRVKSGFESIVSVFENEYPGSKIYKLTLKY